MLGITTRLDPDDPDPAWPYPVGETRFATVRNFSGAAFAKHVREWVEPGIEKVIYHDDCPIV